jgi:hypothetical protein
MLHHGRDAAGVHRRSAVCHDVRHVWFLHRADELLPWLVLRFDE